jgi:SAM-dependent methyltransferase
VEEQLLKAMLDLDEHHWWYRGRRRIIATELDRLTLPLGAQLLDAGCGSGRTLDELARFGDVHGIELNEDAAEIARRRGLGEVVVGRVEELPWPADTFDLITCLDVIEHTPDDGVALRELRRVAKPAGWLLVTVPAYQSLWSAHDDANHHYRRYSRRSLIEALTGAGWQPARITAFNSVLLAPAAAIRLARRARSRNGAPTGDLHLGPRWLNEALEAPLRIEARWLGSGRTLPAGLSLMALAKNALQ